MSYYERSEVLFIGGIMYIKYLGSAFNTETYKVEEAPDCTLGKVYEIVGIDDDKECYFYDDIREENFSCTHNGFGKFEVVDKEGNVL